MKFMLTAIILVFSALLQVNSAVSAETAAPAEKKALSASQQRMVDCNKSASGKTGDARKTYMSTCMQADKSTVGSQQNRMVECNKAAAGKKGDDRKAFMSGCLKNK